MNNAQMKQLRIGLSAVMDEVVANPAKLNALQVTYLLSVVREGGFHVGTALKSLRIQCGRAGLGDQLEEIEEELRQSRILASLLDQKKLDHDPIRLNPRVVAQSMATSSHGWRTAGREETLDSVGFRA